MTGTTVALVVRDLAHLKPWLGCITAACLAWSENPYLLAAICLRESGAGWAPGYEPKGKPDGWGDGGNAFGLWQIDVRFHRAFVLSPVAKDPNRQATYACRLLHENREAIKHALRIAPDDLERAAVAAYNAGPGAVIHRIVSGQDPDSATTGKNYAADVFERLATLRLADPNLFTPGIA